MKTLKVSVLNIEEKGKGCKVKVSLKEDKKPYVCVFEQEFQGKRVSFASRDSTAEVVTRLPLIIEELMFKHQADKVFGFVDIIEGMRVSYEEKLAAYREGRPPMERRLMLPPEKKKERRRIYNTEKVRGYRAARKEA